MSMTIQLQRGIENVTGQSGEQSQNLSTECKLARFAGGSHIKSFFNVLYTYVHINMTPMMWKASMNVMKWLNTKNPQRFATAA